MVPSDPQKKLNDLVDLLRGIDNLDRWWCCYTKEKLCKPQKKEKLNIEALLEDVTSHPPKTHVHALFYRRLAIRELPQKDHKGKSEKLSLIEYDKDIDKNNFIRGEWQSYWLSCCRSSKCDYIFGVLAGCGIDREKDLSSIMANESFTKPMDTREKKGHFDSGINYLLRRYSVWGAFKLYLQSQKSMHESSKKRVLLPRFAPLVVVAMIFIAAYLGPWSFGAKLLESSSPWPYLLLAIMVFVTGFGLLRFSLPRLWGAIIVGILFLMSGQEGWEKPARLFDASQITFVFMLAITIIMAVVYLSYECGKVTEYGRARIFGRSVSIGLIGLLESAAISAFFVGCVLLPVHNSIIDPDGIKPDLGFWVTWGVFTAAAFLIGIFLQSFWEEKTIAEPL